MVKVKNYYLYYNCIVFLNLMKFVMESNISDIRLYKFNFNIIYIFEILLY